MEEPVTARGTTNRDRVRGNFSVVSSSTTTVPEAGKISCGNKARIFNSCLQGTFEICSQQTIAKTWQEVH